jgi:RNA polymerase sigma-70 factor (ECF subfamily)
MIAAVHLPHPLLSDMAISPAVRPDDDNRESLTSFELVLRAKTGDERARDLLIERYQSRLRRWAHGRLPPSARGAHETHDLVQDTLLQVLNNLDRFNPRHEGAFQGFVRTILANRIRDLARRWNRRGISDPIEGDELPGHGVSPLDEAIGAEIRGRYEAALMRLRPEDRELIIARIEMGLPYKEMVEMFKKPSVSAVTMAVNRAVVKLAQEMAHA